MQWYLVPAMFSRGCPRQNRLFTLSGVEKMKTRRASNEEATRVKVDVPELSSLLELSTELVSAFSSSFVSSKYTLSLAFRAVWARVQNRAKSCSVSNVTNFMWLEDSVSAAHTWTRSISMIFQSPRTWFKAKFNTKSLDVNLLNIEWPAVTRTDSLLFSVIREISTLMSPMWLEMKNITSI